MQSTLTLEKLMEHMKMETKNIANENFEKLVELFPNAVTETVNENGEIVRAIDINKSNTRCFFNSISRTKSNNIKQKYNKYAKCQKQVLNRKT